MWKLLYYNVIFKCNEPIWGKFFEFLVFLHDEIVLVFSGITIKYMNKKGMESVTRVCIFFVAPNVRSSLYRFVLRCVYVYFSHGVEVGQVFNAVVQICAKAAYILRSVLLIDVGSGCDLV